MVTKREIMGNLICFTSPCGGSGCTSASMSLARIASAHYEKRVLFLSFDVISEKMAPVFGSEIEHGRVSIGISLGRGNLAQMLTVPVKKDEFGVSYISYPGYFNPFHNISEKDIKRVIEHICSSELFDLLILDIPFGNSISERICLCCEDVILVSGYLEDQKTYLKGFKDMFQREIDSMSKRASLHIFEPSEDKDSFADRDVDLHGQFGAEVRQLAEKLFGS